MGMLHEERIPEAQHLPSGWIVPEDAQMILRHTDLLLPPELVLDVKPREMPEYKGRKISTKGGGGLKVEVPGLERHIEGKTQQAIYRLTGVRPETQRKIREGKPVKPDVVHRLAHGLGVSVEDLLRR